MRIKQKGELRRFFRFLKEEDVYSEYIEAFTKNCLKYGNNAKSLLLNNFKTSNRSIIATSFSWADTDDKYRFWYYIDRSWCNYLDETDCVFFKKNVCK